MVTPSSRAAPARLTNFMLITRLLLPDRRALQRIPLGAVRLFLEMHGDNPRLVQIHRIVDLDEQEDPLVAVVLLDEIPVLGHRRRRAVGNAVLAEEPGLEILRVHDEAAGSRIRADVAAGTG